MKLWTDAEFQQSVSEATRLGMVFGASAVRKALAMENPQSVSDAARIATAVQRHFEERAEPVALAAAHDENLLTPL